MDSLEEQIAALNAALEAGDFARATEVLKACDLAQLVKSQSVSPALRGMIDRALETARRAQAQRTAELSRLSQLEQAARAQLLEPEQAAARAPQLEHRVATLADRALVIALLCELFDEIAPGEVAARSKRFLEADVEAALASPAVRIFIASCNGEPIGLARVDLLDTSPAFRLREDHRCGYVDQMYVRKAFRKRRLGRRLLQLCEEWVRAQGVEHCMLHAAIPAQGFYAALGYLPTRELFKKL